MYQRFKRSIHIFLELSAPGDKLGRVFDYAMITLIIANAVAIILESVNEYAAAYGSFFAVFEDISVGIFTVEYVMRIWSCTSSRVSM